MKKVAKTLFFNPLIKFNILNLKLTSSFFLSIYFYTQKTDRISKIFLNP